MRTISAIALTLLLAFGGIPPMGEAGPLHEDTKVGVCPDAGEAGPVTAAACNEADAGINVGPHAEFTWNVTDLPNATIWFTDHSHDTDGDVDARLWNFGDGHTSNATNPSHVFPGPGTYRVQLRVWDDGGLWDDATTNVTLGSGANHAPIIDPISNQNVTWNDTLVVPVSASDADGDPFTLSISDGPANASLAGSTFSWTPTDPALRNITVPVTLRADDGTAARETTFWVDVREPSSAGNETDGNQTDDGTDDGNNTDDGHGNDGGNNTDDGTDDGHGTDRNQTDDGSNGGTHDGTDGDDNTGGDNASGDGSHRWSRGTRGDRDGDGAPDVVDNCPTTPNRNQTDIDDDRVGDACDGDMDGDAVGNDADNCPRTFNPKQVDHDSNGIGDACEDHDHDHTYATPHEAPLASTPSNGTQRERGEDATAPLHGVSGEYETLWPDRAPATNSVATWVLVLVGAVIVGPGLVAQTWRLVQLIRRPKVKAWYED